MEFLLRIEETGYGTWIRESSSLWAFPMYLFMHTLGMAIIVGGATIISFALLGVWPKGAPIRPLIKLYPFMWVAFLINLFTGVSIFMKDANSYGRNTDFYVKLVFVIGGVIMTRMIQTRVLTDPQLDAGVVPARSKRLAVAALLCWFFAMIAGRLIAYVGPVPGL